MKCFLIVNQLNDPFYIDYDKDFASYIIKRAKDKGLIEKDADITELDPNLVMQLFSPLILSQWLLIDQTNAPCSSICCPDGFLFVFKHIDDLLFLTINGDGTESEVFLQRKLQVFITIMRFMFGPAIEEIGHGHSYTKTAKWDFLRQLMRSWSELVGSEQAFLVEAVERVQVNQMVNEKCLDVLEKSVKQLRVTKDQPIQHAVLIVHNKLLALYSNRTAHELHSKDILTLMILAKTMHPNKDRFEDLFSQQFASNVAKSAYKSPPDENSDGVDDEFHSAPNTPGGERSRSPSMRSENLPSDIQQLSTHDSLSSEELLRERTISIGLLSTSQFSECETVKNTYDTDSPDQINSPETEFTLLDMYKEKYPDHVFADHKSKELQSQAVTDTSHVLAEKEVVDKKFTNYGQTISVKVDVHHDAGTTFEPVRSAEVEISSPSTVISLDHLHKNRETTPSGCISAGQNDGKQGEITGECVSFTDPVAPPLSWPVKGSEAFQNESSIRSTTNTVKNLELEQESVFSSNQNASPSIIIHKNLDNQIKIDVTSVEKSNLSVLEINQIFSEDEKNGSSQSEQLVTVSSVVKSSSQGIHVKLTDGKSVTPQDFFSLDNDDQPSSEEHRSGSFLKAQNGRVSEVSPLSILGNYRENDLFSRSSSTSPIVSQSYPELFPQNGQAFKFIKVAPHKTHVKASKINKQLKPKAEIQDVHPMEQSKPSTSTDLSSTLTYEAASSAQVFQGSYNSSVYWPQNIFIETAACLYSPYNIYTLQILPAVTLILLSQAPKHTLADYMYQIIHNIQDLMYGRRFKLSRSRSMSVYDFINSLISKLHNSLKKQKGRVRSLSYEIRSRWEKEDLKHKLLDFLEKDVTVSIPPELESPMLELYKKLKELFSHLFLSHVPYSAQMWEALAQLRLRVNSELVDYKEYLNVKSQRNITMTSYIDEFPGLIHFIFINRHFHQVTAPSLNIALGTEQAMDATKYLKEKIWSMYQHMMTKLTEGYTTVMMRDGDFYFSYFLWFEDYTGNPLPVQESFKPAQKLPYPGILCGSFHRDALQHCFPHAMKGSVHCFEVFLMHLGTVHPSYIADHCKKLTRKMWEMSGETYNSIGLL